MANLWNLAVSHTANSARCGARLTSINTLKRSFSISQYKTERDASTIPESVWASPRRTSTSRLATSPPARSRARSSSYLGRRQRRQGGRVAHAERHRQGRWGRLDGRRSLAEVVAALTPEHEEAEDGALERDVLGLVAALVARRMLVTA